MNTMKNNFLMRAFVCLFAVVALCSCDKDETPKSADCEIVSFSVDTVDWTINDTIITHTYPAEMIEPNTMYYLAPTITLSPGATVSPSADQAQNFFTTQGVTYIVTAEDGVTTKTYIAKATVEATVEEDPTSTFTDNTITATVGNSFNDKIDVVKAEIYSDASDDEVELASAAYSNGGFTLKLPETVSDTYLAAFEADDFGDGVKVSNLNVKTGSLYIYAYKSGEKVGEFTQSTSSEDVIVIYMYSNGDVSITGDDEIEGITVKYNVQLKKGWNILYANFNELTTQKPSVTLKWYYNEWGSSSSSSSYQGVSAKKVPSLLSKSRIRL